MTTNMVSSIRAALGVGVLLCTVPAAHADISGKVFRDFNANGTFDTSASFNEVGVVGATVKAFDASGTEKGSATSAADGSYTLTGLTAGTKYRLEFTWAESWLKPGVAGGTSVQFVDDGANTANLALSSADAFTAPTDPRLIIATYRSGTGVASTDAAIQSFPRSYSGLNSDYTDANGQPGQGPQPSTDAQLKDVGSTWGMAWQANKKRAYAASFLKRHVGLAHGLGAVYVLDESNQPGSFVKYFDLQGVTPLNAPTESIDLGSVCRDATCATEAGKTGIAADYVLPDDKNTPSVDMDAFYKVGKVGFGDIDMQPGTDILWLVNANQKALISVDVGNADVTQLPGKVNQYAIANLPGAPSCTGGSVRPWALNFSQGKGYLGVTCDAFDSRAAADLKSMVLSFDPNNMSAGFSSVLSFPLNYPREISWGVFQPWLNETEATTGFLSLAKTEGQVDLPQPLLSDIEFDDNGNMYLDIMDLFPHQMGNYNYKPYSGGSAQLVNGIANGDFLKACKTAVGFALEGSADCAVNFPSGVGPNSTGEFFEDTAGDNRGESANGAMAFLHGSGQINAVVMDPHPTGQTGQQWWTTQGVNSYSLTDGKISNWYSLHTAGEASLFGKGTGFGDIELLTDAAPVEIGNRVWLDKDADGIQDADEVGIADVNVVLTCASGTATAKTDATGQYLFSSATNATFMQAGAACTLSIDNTQATLSGLKVTLTDADNITTNDSVTDLRDSDATDKTATAEIGFTVGNLGENNHTLDFGYTPPKTDLKLTKTVNKTMAKAGDTLTYTLTLSNESDVDATNVTVTDNLPTGVTLVTATPSAGTFNAGAWSLPSVKARTTVTLTLDVTVN